MSVRFVPYSMGLLAVAGWMYQRDRNVLALICLVLAVLGPVFAFLDA